MYPWIEKAPSGRARCRICRKKINKGEDRLAWRWGYLKDIYYYHVKCYIENNSDELINLFKTVILYMAEIFPEKLYGINNILWGSVCKYAKEIQRHMHNGFIRIELGYEPVYYDKCGEIGESKLYFEASKKQWAIVDGDDNILTGTNLYYESTVYIIERLKEELEKLKVSK